MHEKGLKNVPKLMDQQTGKVQDFWDSRKFGIVILTLKCGSDILNKSYS